VTEYTNNPHDRRAVPAATDSVDEPMLTRRQALIAGAAAGVALGGLAIVPPLSTGAESGTSSADAGAKYLAGAITAIEARDTLQLRALDGIRTVKIRQGAAVHRAATVVDGELAFTIGEEIVAEGVWSGEVFAATALHTMHRVIEARVVAREGQQVRTDRGGVITLTSETRPRDSFAGHALPTSRVTPGAEVAVLGRIDPRSGTLIAELISDRSHGS
jgi:hypothetical protein